MIVNVPTINDKICNLTQVIIELSSVMAAQQSLVISLISEGPCAEHVGLYALLDRLCHEYNYNKRNVTIKTANFCEKHSEYRIVFDFNFWELERARQNVAAISSLPKQFDQNFKHFGHFIGHGNIYRLQLGSHLFNNHKHKTLQTYHFDSGLDYHREFVGVEDLIYAGKSHKETAGALDFLYSCPLKLDQINTYPILQPANIGIGNYYHLFFVEIVNQTYFSGNIFYIDEKVWRPMLLKTPFMIQGPKQFISNLRKLGFETFDQYWREDYSLDPDNCQVEAMMSNIDLLAQLSVDDLKDMYNSMQPALEHNRRLALSLTKRDFETQSLD